MSVPTKKILWKSFFWLNWVIIGYFWFTGTGSGFFDSTASIIIGLGRISGLAATYTVLVQFFLMGRSPWLESVFGLDKLSRLHQFNGKLAFYMIVLHPILIVVGYDMLTGLGLWGQFVSLLVDTEHIILALIGLILFVTVVSTSISIVRSRWRYEAWYFVHLATYGAIFISFFHQVGVGEDLIGNQVFYSYWVGLYVIVFASHLTFRFVRPLYRSWVHEFTVARIVRESPTAVSLYISGKNLNRFPVHPGQFMIFRFLTKKLWWQAHPFSLSMVPDGKELRLTVKELGDFTRQMKDLAIGTRLIIDGPYGVFTDLFSASTKVLMIAGGIGITPIRSLLEEMLSKGKDVTLLYGNRTADDVVFKEELERLSEKYPTKIVHVFSAESDTSHETGYIDTDKISRLVPDASSREVYLCGPAPMMESLIKALPSLGILKNKIHYEKFAF